MPDFWDIVIVSVAIVVWVVVGSVRRRRNKSKSREKDFRVEIARIKVELCKLLGVSEIDLDKVVASWTGGESNIHLLGLTVSDITQRLRDAQQYVEAGRIELAKKMLDVAKREMDALAVQLKCLMPLS